MTDSVFPTSINIFIISSGASLRHASHSPSHQIHFVSFLHLLHWKINTCTPQATSCYNTTCQDRCHSLLILLFPPLNFVGGITFRFCCYACPSFPSFMNGKRKCEQIKFMNVTDLHEIMEGSGLIGLSCSHMVTVSIIIPTSFPCVIINTRQLVTTVTRIELILSHCMMQAHVHFLIKSIFLECRRALFA